MKQDIHELIPIQVGSIGAEQGIPTVDARNILKWLDIHKDYSSWIKHQIQSLQLVENSHYTKFTQKGELSATGQTKIEYHVTIDTAKHMVMASRTARGREARDYFIEVDKRFRQATSGEDLSEGDMLVRMAMAYREQQKCLDALEAQQRQDQLAIIQTQKDLIELQHGVIEANHNALLAIQSMQWVTIRQYVEMHDMSRQMPLPVQRSYATWLNTYCLERGSAMYKAATADKEWPYEKTYCIAVIQDTLSGWLKRYRGAAQEEFSSSQA